MKNKVIAISMVLALIFSLIVGVKVFARQEKDISTKLRPWQSYAYTRVGDQKDSSKQYFDVIAKSSTALNFSAYACIDKKVWWGWDRASHFAYLNSFDEEIREEFGRRSVGKGTALQFAIQNGNSENNEYDVRVIVITY